MDVTWTDWSAFKQEDEDGNKSRPLAGASADRKIDVTYALRCGTEYLIFGEKVIIPVRGGLFYDPRPSLDNPTDVYGFSVGRRHYIQTVQPRWPLINSGGQTTWMGKTSVSQKQISTSTTICSWHLSLFIFNSLEN